MAERDGQEMQHVTVCGVTSPGRLLSRARTAQERLFRAHAGGAGGAPPEADSACEALGDVLAALSKHQCALLC